MPTRRSLRITRERRRLLSLRILHDERVLKIVIRLVLLRLGANRDVRDLIIYMCLPNGTIENPFVLE